MRRGVGPAWMAGGVLLGAVMTALVAGLVVLPFGLGRSTILMDRLPAPVLGRVLLGPAASTIVADSRARYSLIGGVRLYGKPALQGPLCRVQVYAVSAYFFQGKADPQPIHVSNWYGVTQDPATCDDFTDFENLFQYDGYGRPEEVVQMLETIRRDAQDGNLSIGTRCADRKERCDPMPTLRTLNPRHIAGVEPASLEAEVAGAVTVQRVYIHANGDRTMPPRLEIVIRSQRATPGQQPVVQEVGVENR